MYQQYQILPELEDIIDGPDLYAGSVRKQRQTLWVYDDDDTWGRIRMVLRVVSYAPVLYRIFDEILVNAANNKQRDPEMDRIEVNINQTDQSPSITVYNNGKGIPVEECEELIFGNLPSWYRCIEFAKLTNIFSKTFVIETADGNSMYKQAFKDNMFTMERHVTKTTEEWTRVTFMPDLEKFNMTNLEDDVVALMKKRVVDLAGCLSQCPGKKVKVFLNGKEIKLNSFHDYAQLYLNSANKNRENSLPRIDHSDAQWQISVSLSDGQFQQVSFVNNINTILGGTHVDYITDRIVKCVINAVKKNKNANLKPHIVKNHLWVFVNAFIDNPTFNPGTKTTLITPVNSFGTTCELPDKFLDQVLSMGRKDFKQWTDLSYGNFDNYDILTQVRAWGNLGQMEHRKTDGSKTRKKVDVPKLVDAYEAGGSKSQECTLILTEGYLGKVFEMVGYPVLRRDYYGVFPLQGKMLNVGKANAQQIIDNADFNYLQEILGLKQGAKFDEENSVMQLRYGRIMMMVDQDHVGSHIKGRLIYFIHTFWPSLLRNPSFIIYDFTTPMEKGSRFCDVPELRKRLDNRQLHRRIFTWDDDKDDHAIELAFSMERIEARKAWLQKEECESFPDYKDSKITYYDFVHKELKLSLKADLQRSIPSMVDGLKPTQRKVLFAAFESKFTSRTIYVAEFGHYVSQISSCHDGPASIDSAIIGMAQNFIGANNINLFMPYGQFGTRYLGGKDAARSGCIFTNLTEITRFIFPKDDDVLLEYLKEDQLNVEPIWYLPIIPMVLVNGAEGEGTNWSTFVPNYNPKDIIANLKHLLEGDEPIKPMHPWYRKYEGKIIETKSREKDADPFKYYTVSGSIDLVCGDDSIKDDEDVVLRITGLPIKRWTRDYKKFIRSLANPNNKTKEIFIKDFCDFSYDDFVHIVLVLSKRNYNIAKQKGLEETFKLRTTLSTSNMHLFDEHNKIVRYASPEHILMKFYELRLAYYERRKENYLKIYAAELSKLNRQCQSIRRVIDGDIVSSECELEASILPGTVESAVVGATESESTEETLSSAMKLNVVKEKIEKVRNQIEKLKKETNESLWLKDLNDLEKALDEKQRREEELEKDCLPVRDMLKESEADFVAAAAAKNLTKLSTYDEDISEEGRGRHPNRNAPKEAAVTKKRSLAESQADQNVISDSFNMAASDSETSPERKVRRMRHSAFNKKSGSVLNQEQSSSASPDSTENIEGSFWAQLAEKMMYSDRDEDDDSTDDLDDDSSHELDDDSTDELDDDSTDELDDDSTDELDDDSTDEYCFGG